MLEETVRLNQTIDGLLILSKTEAQQTGGTAALINFPAVGEEILNLLEVVLEERHIMVTENHDVNSRRLIRADRNFVRVALLNVLHNAVKFSPPGSSILISYSRSSLHGHPAEQVCITDAGPGISQAEHEKVFERFFTSRNHETKSQSGAGLGLSTSKLAIERSGGSIFFDRTVASGARCCIKLPVSALE